jgi:hypothetical protein
MPFDSLRADLVAEVKSAGDAKVDTPFKGN